MRYIPKRVLFEQNALKYTISKRIHQFCQNNNIVTDTLKSHNRVSGIPGNAPQEAYAEGKNTLVIGIRKTLQFESCKPSAHYQLPLLTSCAGKCEYCYLNTQIGKKPYIRVYANINEILKQAEKYIDERSPDITIFEGAATSDPIVVEYLTGSLFETISFFGKQDNGRFRFVTKFTDVDSILSAKHNEHTTVRFSINANIIIKRYEHATPTIDERVEASYKILNAGYSLGFIIAPVFLYDGWKKDYGDMLNSLVKKLSPYKSEKIYFEVISHRYTERAKKNILEIFPSSRLPMDNENRKFKFGQFGYGKYVYTDELLNDMKEFFREKLGEAFPNGEISYII